MVIFAKMWCTGTGTEILLIGSIEGVRVSIRALTVSKEKINSTKLYRTPSVTRNLHQQQGNTLTQLLGGNTSDTPFPSIPLQTNQHHSPRISYTVDRRTIHQIRPTSVDREADVEQREHCRWVVCYAVLEADASHGEKGSSAVDRIRISNSASNVGAYILMHVSEPTVLETCFTFQIDGYKSWRIRTFKGLANPGSGSVRLSRWESWQG